jgi:hypothetical protein
MDTGFSALGYALGAIETNLRGLTRSAQEIAAGRGDRGEPIELAAPLVHAIEQQRAIEASANVLARTDRMLGTLIDTFS